MKKEVKNWFKSEAIVRAKEKELGMPVGAALNSDNTIHHFIFMCKAEVKSNETLYEAK